MTRALLLPVAIITFLTIIGAIATPVAAQDDDPADPGPIPGAIGEPAQPLDEKRLYDMANLLSNEEEAQIESEAARLAGHGIPSVTILQASDLSPEDAAAFAEEIRSAWSVESSPGADDGLVILVTVDLTDESVIFPVMSWGSHALPHFGVDQATANRVETEWLNAYLQQGHIFAAIDYSLRRLIYHSIYDPAPQESLSSAQSTMRTVITVLAPLIAIGGMVLAIRRWRGASPRRTVTGVGLAIAWSIPVTATVIGGLAVWSHSGWGVLAALALLAVAVIGWVRHDPANRRDAAVGTPGHARP